MNCFNFYAFFYCCCPSFYDSYEYKAFDQDGVTMAQQFYSHDYELFYDSNEKKFVEAQSRPPAVRSCSWTLLVVLDRSGESVFAYFIFCAVTSSTLWP